MRNDYDVVILIAVGTVGAYVALLNFFMFASRVIEKRRRRR